MLKVKWDGREDQIRMYHSSERHRTVFIDKRNTRARMLVPRKQDFLVWRVMNAVQLHSDPHSSSGHTRPRERTPCAPPV